MNPSHFESVKSISHTVKADEQQTAETSGSPSWQSEELESDATVGKDSLTLNRSRLTLGTENTEHSI